MSIIIILDLLEDIYSMGNYMVHANPDITYSYYELIKDDLEISRNRGEICGKIVAGMEAAEAFEKEFDEYFVLWEEDRQEFLHQFLVYGRLLTLDELYRVKEEGEGAVKEQPPTIKQFKDQIDYYEEMYKKVKFTNLFKWGL